MLLKNNNKCCIKVIKPKNNLIKKEVKITSKNRKNNLKIFFK